MCLWAHIHHVYGKMEKRTSMEGSVGRLVNLLGWLAGWLIVWLVNWFVCWLGWLVVWSSVCWLFGFLVCLDCLFVGWLVS